MHCQSALSIIVAFQASRTLVHNARMDGVSASLTSNLDLVRSSVFELQNLSEGTSLITSYEKEGWNRSQSGGPQLKLYTCGRKVQLICSRMMKSEYISSTALGNGICRVPVILCYTTSHCVV